MNLNDQYKLWTFVFLIRLTVCKSPSERIQHPSKRHYRAGPRMTQCRKPSHSRTKENLYSDPGGTLENKLNDLKPLFSRKKSLTFQKRSKKMFLRWRANLADQNKQQPLKIKIRDTCHVRNKRLIDKCQHCSTSQANQALRSLANAGFLKSRGLSAGVSFLPLPLPQLSFFGSCLISRAAKTENPVPRSFFTPKPNGNACYAGYLKVPLFDL